MLSAVVGGGLPSCGGRPPWGLFVSRVLLGLSDWAEWVGGVVLRGLDFRSIRYVSPIVGTVRGGRLFATFRRAGWCSGAGGSLGGGFPRGGGLRLVGEGA